jgi:ubiquinone/menaquinone biosynthesis C-methylase UbiE
MGKIRQPGGSATRWGPLFGERARDWADTWEGTGGYGTPLYEHVLDRAKIGAGTRVLDCGCGAGRFVRMATDRGAIAAGIDAAKELVAIAGERTPEGDFRVGDLEVLPWPDSSFDVVTGFNAFQFADDKARALAEARRVSRGPVAVVIPTRGSESGILSIFKPLFPLYPPRRWRA